VPVSPSKSLLLRIRDRALVVIRISFFASLVVFKLMEWWYDSEEQRQQRSSPGQLVVPPPPLPHKVRIFVPGMLYIMFLDLTFSKLFSSQPCPELTGIQLPSDLNVCALCVKPRTNPAVASSGYVFCYPCINRYVSEHARCPITALPTTCESIRRVFESE
jgi:hypothetical protein